MTREEALKIVEDRYDVEALMQILRFSEKNPSNFTLDDGKEYIDVEDVLEGLICIELTRPKETL